MDTCRSISILGPFPAMRSRLRVQRAPNDGVDQLHSAIAADGRGQHALAYDAGMTPE